MPTAAQLASPTFLQPSLAVDIVVFTNLHPDEHDWHSWQSERPDERGPSPDKPGWYVLMIGRRNPPYPYEEDYHCLPGGFVDYNEDPKKAAPRELHEETNIPRHKMPRKMPLVGVYGDPGRDSRRHVVSIAYSCVLAAPDARHAYGGDDAKFTVWVHLQDILDGKVKIGFDHEQIIKDAMTIGL